jgi:hypothetical protein
VQLEAKEVDDPGERRGREAPRDGLGVVLEDQHALQVARKGVACDALVRAPAAAAAVAVAPRREDRDGLARHAERADQVPEEQL